jgi:hypothetical protein
MSPILYHLLTLDPLLSRLVHARAHSSIQMANPGVIQMHAAATKGMDFFSVFFSSLFSVKTYN